MYARPHHRQLNLVLDVLDMNGAALGLAPHQCRDHLLGEHGDLLAHASRGRTLRAINGDKGLGHGHRDLRRLKRDHRAVAADHLVVGEPRICAGLGSRQQGGLAVVVGRNGFGAGLLHLESPWASWPLTVCGARPDWQASDG